jgi:hypothetical protein
MTCTTNGGLHSELATGDEIHFFAWLFADRSLREAWQHARELLHEGDLEDGCEKACYACLLSFYDQREHHLLDRTLMLPWLQTLMDLMLTPEVAEDRFATLLAQCKLDLERKVLRAICQRGLSVPDAAQKTFMKVLIRSSLCYCYK